MTIFKKELITALYEHDVLKIDVDNPVSIAGIDSPLQVNFSKALDSPDIRARLGEGLREFILSETNKESATAIIGVAPHGIPWASLAAELIKVPLLTASNEVKGRVIFLIDDKVISGKSMAESYTKIRSAGAKRIIPVTLFSFRFKESFVQMRGIGTTFKSILNPAYVLLALEKQLSKRVYESIQDFILSPYTWPEKHTTEALAHI